MTSTFVDSWRLPNQDDDSKCTNDEQNDGTELVCTDDIKSKAQTICEKLLSNVKFSDCLKVRNFNYNQFCPFDLVA